MGNETTADSSMPVCISDIESSPLKGKNIIDVHNYGSTIIAKDSSGKLYSWGNNDSGELGNGTTKNSSMPVCISDIENSSLKGKNIVKVYSNGYTMIVKDSNGKLYSWGYNGYGQLGDGTTTNSSMPICISDVENSELKGKKIKNVEYNSYNNGIYHNSLKVYYYVTENGEYYEYSFTPIQ